MKYLNIASKNISARAITKILSNNNFDQQEGFSKFNKVYKFITNISDQKCQMIMTSICKNPMVFKFCSTLTGIDHFTDPVSRISEPKHFNIIKTIETEVIHCDAIILWTDCDNEGDNAAHHIVKICQAIKPNLVIKRAMFSSLSETAIFAAIENLTSLHFATSAAFELQAEIDFRVRSKFTQLKININANPLSCCDGWDLPILRLVTQKVEETERFFPEKFWNLTMTHEIDSIKVDFFSNRTPIFDEQCCASYLQVCRSAIATVTHLIQTRVTRSRPLPLNIVELLTSGCNYLQMPGHEIIAVSEKLYSEGIISYPRSHSNVFSANFDYLSLIKLHVEHPLYGGFAKSLVEQKPMARDGDKYDHRHPPIHPTKYRNDLTGNEAKVYNFVVTHFLACVSRDAVALQRTATVHINNEEFTANGLMILEQNFLKIYSFQKWNEVDIFSYYPGQQFHPTNLAMNEKMSIAPPKLTEADLILLMDKSGIGTDGCYADFIYLMKQKKLITQDETKFICPGTLTVNGKSDIMECLLTSPNLRAQCEKENRLVANDLMTPSQFLREQINKYKNAFDQILECSIVPPSINYLNDNNHKTVEKRAAVELSQIPDPSLSTLNINDGSNAEVTTINCKNCGKKLSRIEARTPANVGKYFFKCCKNFFLWAEGTTLSLNPEPNAVVEVNNQSGSSKESNSTTTGSSKGLPKAIVAVPKKNIRKCSVCAASGHNKTTCPFK